MSRKAAAAGKERYFSYLLTIFVLTSSHSEPAIPIVFLTIESVEAIIGIKTKKQAILAQAKEIFTRSI